MKPEEKVEIILWDWLNKYKNIEIFFNRENKLGWKKFKTKEVSKKPDFIISFYNEFKGKEYVAIEIKNGIIGRNIFDSFKILNTYYKNYANGKTKYFIEEKEIKINYFIVATQFSKYGKLFIDDNKIIDNIDKGKNDDWRKMSAKSKTLPRCEYEKTRMFLRQLWSLFREFRKNNSESKYGLGILLSDIIINFHPEELKIQSGMIGKPILLLMQYKEWLKKPQWQQNIIKIGLENE